jgi:hypothetical protein
MIDSSQIKPQSKGGHDIPEVRVLFFCGNAGFEPDLERLAFRRGLDYSPVPQPYPLPSASAGQSMVHFGIGPDLLINLSNNRIL